MIKFIRKFTIQHREVNGETQQRANPWSPITWVILSLLLPLVFIIQVIDGLYYGIQRFWWIFSEQFKPKESPSDPDTWFEEIRDMFKWS